MSKNSDHVIRWRRRTKRRIIESFGNKCGVCNYDKCDDAFDLHHLNPNEKEFGFGGVRASPKSWDKIVVELRKCVLLCNRCHREVHSGLTELSLSIQRFNEFFADYMEINRRDREAKMIEPCPECNGPKPIGQKTCSYKCAAKTAYKYDWGNFDLKDMYVDQKMSQSSIARIVGCSDVAVRKRLIKLGLRTM